MTGTPPRLSLDGMLDFIPKSRPKLAPLFEAISNALESIAERRKTADAAYRGRITVRLYFTGLLNEEKELESIEVLDNGVGFDAANYERFVTFLDRSKGFKNRGTGRVQYLHFADKVEVTSHYAVGRQVFKRHFFCSPKTYITEPTNQPAAPSAEIGTTIVLSGFKHAPQEQAFFDSLTLADLRSALKSTYLLWLHLEKAGHPKTAASFRLEFYKNNKRTETGDLTPDDIPVPLTGKINVPYVKIKDAKADSIEWVPQPKHAEQLHWAHFQLDESELTQNAVVLCSKNVAVQRLRFDSVKKTEAVGGHRFLTAIHGPTLDSPSNVSHAVDHFTFPKRADTEKAVREDLFFEPDREYLFFDDIEQAVEGVLPHIYADLFARKADQQKDVEEIAKAHGIPLEVAHTTKIHLSDSVGQITEKLFKKHAESLAHQSLKIKQLFDALDALDPADANYQAELEQRSSELLELIPEQNKQELSRYIIRRQMVAKVLGMIINEKIVGRPKKTAQNKKPRHDREGLIHDLLIKRKSGSTSGPNDLWVLNEEFVHFEGCSDVPIDQIADSKGNRLLRPITADVLETYGIKPERRPDIFLYAEESQCILIELKAPDVDLADYLNQLPKYCNLIANFSVTPIARFYCYLIGETLSPIDIGGDYRRNVHGDWVRRTDYPIMRYENGRQDEEIGKAQIEVIKLSSIHARRALRRNKSFADRLGISDASLDGSP